MLFKELGDFRQMLLDQYLYDFDVLLDTRQTDLVYVPHFTFFDQRDEYPECQRARAMHQKLSDQKVHALDIIGLFIVTGEGSQDFSQLEFSSLPLLEVLIPGERS